MALAPGGGEFRETDVLPTPVRSRERETLDAVSRHARRLAGTVADDDELMRLLGGAAFALIGEASHGTDDFYRERAAITRRLIVDHGLAAVAVEADWPDALRVNRYVRGLPGDEDGRAALGGFRRFPTWMWRNTAVLEFVEWLRRHNAALASTQRVGFYGIDLYSLFGSVDAVLSYLDREDPEAAVRARRRYACFDAYREDAQAYGYATRFAMSASCEDAVVAQLRELLSARAAQAALDAGKDDDARFHAEENARLVKNAEAYYRTMFGSRVDSWNLRDSHMVETLEALRRHLGRGRAAPPRIAVWAHKSHLGDARATELGEAGEWNVGQLVRERHGEGAALLGFSTYEGTVAAASDWDGPLETKRVRPGLAGSWEALFHDTGLARFALPMRGERALVAALATPRLQRAIGVIYRPETERQSHYFLARPAQQFDAIVHLDRTRAVSSLDAREPRGSGEAPETFPSGV
jgi:erythromycin esterase-like protein